MANLQTQQARVLFLDGQTIILQNDAGDSSYGDINAELLQQALQSVGVNSPNDDCETTTPSTTASDASFVVSTATTAMDMGEALHQDVDSCTNNFRLIFDDLTETSVRFSREDAEALGLKILVEDHRIKQEQLEPIEELQNVGIAPNEQTAQDNQQQVVFTTQSNEVTVGVPSLEEGTTKTNDTEFQVTSNSLGALVGAATSAETISVDRPVTLVPQVVDGHVSYTVQFSAENTSPADQTDLSNCNFATASSLATTVADTQPVVQEVFSITSQRSQSPVVTQAVKTLQVEARPQVNSRKAPTTNRIRVHVVGGRVLTQTEDGEPVALGYCDPVPVSPPPISKVPVTNFDSGKPLGSSENPIQLVQHGQTFHSVQALTREQLKQIATVLQQQQLDKAPRSKNIVYDAETNTRIIYRVVYPEDLDLCEPGSPATGRGRTSTPPPHLHGGAGRGGIGRGSGRRGRPPGVRGKRPGASASPERSHNHDDADDAARTERKRMLLSRTRSGRLSRPPRHMVKDYKRLHRLDFADADLDDSDGGYSDYQVSEHEETGDGELGGNKTAAPGDSAIMNHTVLPTVPKRKISPHFRCPACQKVYLGHSRMARHLEAFPDHAINVAVPTSDIAANEDGGEKDPSATQTASAEEEKLPDPSPITNPTSVLKTTSNDAPTPEPLPNGVLSSTVRRVGAPPGPRRKGKRRGPWAYLTPEARSQRRKNKLLEAMSVCETAEVVEVCGRRVCHALSLVELLWWRLETLAAGQLLEEIATLLEEVRLLFTTALTKDEGHENCDDCVEVCGDVLCAAIGIESGSYHVDVSKMKPPTTLSQEASSTPNTDSTAVAEPDEKKPRMEKPETSSEMETSPLKALGLQEQTIVPATEVAEKESTKVNIKEESPSTPADVVRQEELPLPLPPPKSLPTTSPLEPHPQLSPLSNNSQTVTTSELESSPQLPPPSQQVSTTQLVSTSQLVPTTQLAAASQFSQLVSVKQLTSQSKLGSPSHLPSQSQLGSPRIAPQAQLGSPSHLAPQSQMGSPSHLVPQSQLGTPSHLVPQSQLASPHLAPQSQRGSPHLAPQSQLESSSHMDLSSQLVPAAQISPLQAPSQLVAISQTEQPHTTLPHPLEDELLEGLCCETEEHSHDEEAGHRAALQAVDEIVRERLCLVDFLDEVPPPPQNRIKLPAFASLQPPHRTTQAPVAPPPYLSLPDLSDHIDLDVLNEELGTAMPVTGTSAGS